MVHLYRSTRQWRLSLIASTHPCLRPCPTTNLSERSPSSNRTHACMPLWNWRITASILGGMPKRARTSHIRVRSTESYALVRSIKHKYKGVSFFCANSCSHRTTNILPIVEGWGFGPTLFLWQKKIAFAVVTKIIRDDDEIFKSSAVRPSGPTDCCFSSARIASPTSCLCRDNVQWSVRGPLLKLVHNARIKVSILD